MLKNRLLFVARSIKIWFRMRWNSILSCMSLPTRVQVELMCSIFRDLCRIVGVDDVLILLMPSLTKQAVWGRKSTTNTTTSKASPSFSWKSILAKRFDWTYICNPGKGDCGQQFYETEYSKIIIDDAPLTKLVLFCLYLGETSRQSSLTTLCVRETHKLPAEGVLPRSQYDVLKMGRPLIRKADLGMTYRHFDTNSKPCGHNKKENASKKFDSEYW